MREFSEWWTSSEKPQCCRFAPDGEIEEGDEFDCETCQVAERIDQLSEDNVRAWVMFHQLCRPFLMESQSVGIVLNRLSADDDAEEFEDLVMRLNLLYDIFCPRKSVEKPDGA